MSAVFIIDLQRRYGSAAKGAKSSFKPNRLKRHDRSNSSRLRELLLFLCWLPVFLINNVHAVKMHTKLVWVGFCSHLHLFTCSVLSSNCAARDAILDFKSNLLPSMVRVNIKSHGPTSCCHWCLKYSASSLFLPSIPGTE